MHQMPLTLERHLAELGADMDIVKWARSYPDLASAWAACDRGDWLLWVAATLARTDAERRAVVGAAAACARLSLDYAPPNEPGPRSAVNAAESWAGGLASGDVVNAAAHGSAYAVMASLRDERAWAASSAAWAAAWAAVWFERQNGTNVGAAQAVRQAAECAGDAAGAYGRPAALARCATLVRERIPCPTLPA